MTVSTPTSTKTEARWRGDWRISVVIAVLVAAGGVTLWLLQHRDRTHGVVLPAALLGLPKVSGQNAQQAAQSVLANEQAGSDIISKPVAAQYGSSSGASLVVVAGGPCQCILPTPQQAVQSMKAAGEADAAWFPPGTPGGLLTCFSYSAGQSSEVIGCTWIDEGSAGQVYFVRGDASTLADAAAKTRQLRDALEH